MLFSSCWPDEGKSTLTLRAGGALAQNGARVLLVDGDSRRPTLSGVVGDSGPTLPEFLNDPEGRQPAGLEANLFYLRAGHDAGLIPSAAQISGFRQATSRFDNILIDSPPMTGCSDAIGLSSLCDGVLLVIARPRYRPAATRQLIRDYRDVGAKLEGILLTHASESTLSSRLPDSVWERILVALGLKP